MKSDIPAVLNRRCKNEAAQKHPFVIGEAPPQKQILRQLFPTDARRASQMFQ